jgi:large subunit ribosomal protein L21
MARIMEYAIITTGGKQYRVQPGDVIGVDKLETDKDTHVFDKVLLVATDGKVEVGKPTVKTTVTAKVLGQTKGEKIYVSKFKAKARYRRRSGFRAQLTKVQIEAIGNAKGAAAPKEKVTKPVVEKTEIKAKTVRVKK